MAQVAKNWQKKPNHSIPFYFLLPSNISRKSDFKVLAKTGITTVTKPANTSGRIEVCVRGITGREAESGEMEKA